MSKSEMVWLLTFKLDGGFYGQTLYNLKEFVLFGDEKDVCLYRCLPDKPPELMRYEFQDEKVYVYTKYNILVETAEIEN